jgi:hypothetical protein
VFVSRGSDVGLCLLRGKETCRRGGEEKRKKVEDLRKRKMEPTRTTYAYSTRPAIPEPTRLLEMLLGWRVGISKPVRYGGLEKRPIPAPPRPLLTPTNH